MQERSHEPVRKLQRQPQKHLGPDHSVRDMRRPSWAGADKMDAEIMTPRDRLQRLLFEHRTAHDPASSEREILRMFEAVEDRPAWQYTLRHMGGLKPYLTQRQYEAQSPAIQKWYEPVAAHTKEQA